MTDSVHSHHHHQNKDVLIELQNVSIAYGKQIVIENISLKIFASSFIVFLGVNGSGKTTIIKAIMGLIPYRGTILLNNQDIKKMSKKQLAKLIAYVPQLFANRGEVTVYDYVSFGRFPYSGSFLLTKEDRSIIAKVIKHLKLEKIQDKFLNQISGGQRQKVALASALVQNTNIIILDEPTTYLDLRSQYDILEITHLLHLQNKTIIMVLHDLNQAIKYADKIAIIDQQKLFGYGDPHQILTTKNIFRIFKVKVLMQEINHKNHIIDVDTKKIMEELKWN